MYVPKAFGVEDRAWTLALIRDYPFGVLITCDREFPRASNVPMIAHERNGEMWIYGHLAKANPQAAAILAGAAATVAFTGPHAYISPRWYEHPDRSVPTWNYLAVQVCGRLKACDPRPVLDELVAAFETGEERWGIEQLDPQYAAAQMQGIVAFELRAEELYAKAKLGQNRSEADQRRIAVETGLGPALGR